MNFAILWYSRKFSLRNLGGVAPLAICESFLCENSIFLPIRESFILRKFPAIQYVKSASGL